MFGILKQIFARSQRLVLADIVDTGGDDSPYQVPVPPCYVKTVCPSDKVVIDCCAGLYEFQMLPLSLQRLFLANVRPGEIVTFTLGTWTEQIGPTWVTNESRLCLYVFTWTYDARGCREHGDRRVIDIDGQALADVIAFWMDQDKLCGDLRHRLRPYMQARDLKAVGQLYW